MNDPMAGCFLPDPFFHEGLLAAEELHRQLVVRGLEQGLQLVLDEALLDLLPGQARPELLLRRPVQGDIVYPEVDLAAPLVIHLVACNSRMAKRRLAFQLESGDKRCRLYIYANVLELE